MPAGDLLGPPEDERHDAAAAFKPPPSRVASTFDDEVPGHVLLQHLDAAEGAGTPSSEGDQRWVLQHGMRSILLGLVLTSSSTTAALVLIPGLYGGCAPAHEVGIVIAVLVFVPFLLLLSNHLCHKRGVSPRTSKLVIGLLLLGYYVLIALFDSRTQVMISGSLPSCVIEIETASHHASDNMMLVDVACNFFVCACLLVTWRTRALHAACHAALWLCDNFTYPKYTSLGTPAQRAWLWFGFLAVEAQMMATIVAIAWAIDTMWASQQARSALEVRLVQMSNEKERLTWEAALRDHQASLLPEYFNADAARELLLEQALRHTSSRRSTSSSSSSLEQLSMTHSHHTAKMRAPDAGPEAEPAAGLTVGPMPAAGTVGMLGSGETESRTTCSELDCMTRSLSVQPHSGIGYARECDRTPEMAEEDGNGTPEMAEEGGRSVSWGTGGHTHQTGPGSSECSYVGYEVSSECSSSGYRGSRYRQMLVWEAEREGEIQRAREADLLEELSAQVLESAGLHRRRGRPGELGATPSE